MSNEMSKVKYGEMGPRASRCGAPFVLLALAQRQPPAMPGSVKRLYSEKDLLVE